MRENHQADENGPADRHQVHGVWTVEVEVAQESSPEPTEAGWLPWKPAADQGRPSTWQDQPEVQVDRSLCRVCLGHQQVSKEATRLL